MTAKVELPTAIDALEGINAALQTADMHLESARVLDRAGIHGPAVSHLILALEEAAKALILIRVWLGQARGFELDMTAEEVHDLIRRSHRLRHIFAGLQSLSDQTLNALLARQNRDEPLPTTGVVAEDLARLDWLDGASNLKEQGFHADLTNQGWRIPMQLSHSDFEVAETHMLPFIEEVRYQASRVQLLIEEESVT